jgi:hypothetical protein
MDAVLKLLQKAYDEAIANHIVDAYLEIERNYVFRKWKPSELDAGHFVETVRRILEKELTGTYTPFSIKIANFSDAVLKGYENASGHDSYRMLIPRILKGVYNVRNKRGVAHISDVSPNEMDATVIFYSVKWVLAEIVRINSSLTPAATQKVLDSIIERQIPIIWKDGAIVTVLDPKLSAGEQVIVLLYDVSPRTEAELMSITEYKNKSNFVKILKRLHAKKLIYRQENVGCRLLPPGLAVAESIISQSLPSE